MEGLDMKQSASLTKHFDHQDAARHRAGVPHVLASDPVSCATVKSLPASVIWLSAGLLRQGG
jgi:hypothetical protein